MTYTYFQKIIDRGECIGNSLSTINIDLTALSMNLSALSSYTTTSINFLSSAIQSVSANLQSQVNILSTAINTVASNSATPIINYVQQGTLFQNSNGVINWNLSANGRNARVVLSANGFLNNIQGSFAGETGNLVIQSNGVSGYSLTGYGSQWLFSQGLSSMTVGVSAYNLISVLNDNNIKFLASMSNF